MNCCDCPWKNPPAIEYEVFEENGLKGYEPCRGTENSSGIDVFIPYGFKTKVLKQDEDTLIPLNMRIKIPKGFDVEVKNKSSIATNKKLIKGAQLIDQDYRGNLMIHLINFAPIDIELVAGMKIAQLVVRPVLINEWKRVDSINLDTERGEGGFGSTGDKA